MKFKIISFGIALISMAVAAKCSYAQCLPILPGLPCGSSVPVTDSDALGGTGDYFDLTMLGTQDIDTVQLPNILRQDTTTATSVTTGEGGANYTPINNYTGGLTTQLFSGINSGNFAQWFPGWVPLPPDSTVSIAIPLSSTVLTTYNAALAIAQSQSNALSRDNLAQIEQVSTSTTDLLAAVQANTDAVLAVAQGLQLERQLLATLITVEATKAGEEFNEKAQEEATNARRWNLGVEPGQ